MFKNENPDAISRFSIENMSSYLYKSVVQGAALFTRSVGRKTKSRKNTTEDVLGHLISAGMFAAHVEGEEVNGISGAIAVAHEHVLNSDCSSFIASVSILTGVSVFRHHMLIKTTRIL